MNTSWMTRAGTACLVAASLVCVAPGALLAQTSRPATTNASQAQQMFATPEAGIDALITAARAGDLAQIERILGPGSARLVHSGEKVADRNALGQFIAAYDVKHSLVVLTPDSRELLIGLNDWPLPLPLRSTAAGWQFDSQAGAQEIIDRTIGRNEIAAITVMLAFVDAQKDFFVRQQQATGTGAYAQRLASTPGKHDGLYWDPVGDEPESPMAPLVRQAIEQGYPGAEQHGRPLAYMGYRFRLLKAQGDDAADGAKSYMDGAMMTRGFALIGWPANYRVTGMMSFIVNTDGVVYQKNLGQDGANGITRFNPDLTWARIDIGTN